MTVGGQDIKGRHTRRGGSDPTSLAQACRDYNGAIQWLVRVELSLTSQEKACLCTASFTMKVLVKK